MFSNTETPFYLQGSQTGDTLQGAQQASTGAYTPGYGQAPLANPPGGYTPGYGSVPYSGMGQWTEDDLASLVRSGQFNTREQAAAHLNGIQSGSAGPAGVSVYSSPTSAAPTSTSGGSSGTSGFTTIGQASGQGWMTPEQMRAATNSLGSISSGASAGGGGGGAVGSSGASSGATGSGSGGGLNLAGYTPQSSSPSLNNNTFPNTDGLTYAPVNDAQGIQNNGSLQMQAANPQAAMQAYQNTPGYQMLGNDQTNQYQQSPGYQYAVNEAMKQVQQNGASRGLLESGSVMRAMTDRAQGMAQQDYGNWWNRQNQLYSDYQNRLAGLAGGNTGGQDAMALGNNLAQGTYQTGSNIGSLFGNQGSTGMGGIINTGAAQSANMTNAGAQQAQVNQANQSTQLAGATIGGQNRGLF